ncbi:MAG: matrixin family metalloprotease [Deltaproteobacteria bacterium]|nr:matrixin family metalloprotease [Deltaproteobacteria bacterium]
MTLRCPIATAALCALLAMASGGPARAWQYYECSLGSPVAWPDCTTQISFSVDAGDIDGIESDGEQVAIADAFAAWNAVACAPIELKIAGYKPDLAAEVKDDGPNENVVVFVNNGWSVDPIKETYIALTTLSYDPDTCELVDADIEFNAEHFEFSLCGEGEEEADRQDFRYVILHETGHVFGLNHSMDPLSIMFVQDSTCADDPGNGLVPDDEEGLCEVYGDPARLAACQGEPAVEADPVEVSGDKIDSDLADDVDSGDDGGKKAADCCCRLHDRPPVPAGSWVLTGLIAVLWLGRMRRRGGWGTAR